MPNIPNPYSELLREPNLLIPGKKPVGRVRPDSDNPLADKLTGCWLFQNSYKDVNGKTLEAYASCSYTGGSFVTDGKEGLVWVISATSDRLSIPITQLSSNAAGFTVVVRGDPGEKGGLSAFTNIDGSGLGAANIPLRTYWGSDGLMDVGFSGTTTTNVTSDVTVGGYKTWSFSNEGSGGRRKVFENGISQLDLAGLSYIVTTANIRLQIGTLTSNYSSCGTSWNQTNCRYSFLMFFDRALSDAEHEEIYRDPYQVLIPA